jgi:hypothetical protein
VFANIVLPLGTVAGFDLIPAISSRKGRPAAKCGNSGSVMGIRQRVKRMLGLGAKPARVPAHGADARVLFADDSLRITTIGDPASPNVFLSFTGLYHAMGSIKMEEFVGTTRLPGYFAIFITDLKRSWFNGFPPEAILEPIAPLVAGKRIVTIGNSLGGFGAIWISRYLPVDVALAFCPQFSVHPDEVPGETRWQEFRREISEWRVRSLEGAFNDATRYYTFNGDGPDEMHWRRLPHLANCTHLLIAGSGHETALFLKERGVLGAVIENAATGGDPLAPMLAAGVAARQIDPPA